MNLMFEILLVGLEENVGLEEKRNFVNSILPVHKYKLMQMFLSDKELSEKIRVNSLLIFLDERTKYLSFVQHTSNQTTIKSILEIIPRYSPNIETVDFRSLRICNQNIKNFETFLKQTTHLKSLRVHCSGIGCAMYELLIFQSSTWLRPELKLGLQKVEYISESDLSPSECVKLIKFLPNLKSLGMNQQLSEVISTINGDDKILKKLSNITEFYDAYTSLTTLQRIIKLCPKVNRIFLIVPGKNVIENLWRFPLLTDIKLVSGEDDNSVFELFTTLKIIRHQIKCLNIYLYNDENDPNIYHKLCPELVKLVFKHKIFLF